VYPLSLRTIGKRFPKACGPAYTLEEPQRILSERRELRGAL
jgi:hypothetical protein